MRKILERQLKNLHQDFANMGFDVASAIQNAIDAFESNDKELAQKVIGNDQNINEQEIYLERKAAQVIALQQPVASDLRILITILKASSDLERIGDHAVSVARAGLRIKEEKKNALIEEAISDMSKHAYEMLEQIIHAYVENDEQLARDVALSDRKTDEYLKKIRKEAFRSMQNDPDFIGSGTEYIVVASHIERIGDYVTNVAEWIVYTNTGRITELG
ncbi:phosphate transport system regulatory protein PhoU [Liquorilactobacillus sucicola DSM 21376 = JCM 15457]|uniref:Phosphate-specific transport system accessory protein PhoU n=1 Tax=Liquorilactobacillus sucicola DSM 21376 = JCM 15457 TaxID=1423806 RepID=A0A023D0W5_9LACO|nr:phosphate signaling complex protein PhoU [Liquorilactobacillus sucicola]KRN06397.1 phosphate transport system regulatory protein PhoU [Liquorilactobacillus sucicola DSM 21376 = JCM 15457]GAJ27476.1 phosphate transport system regulatory protein PhoU [Liquorilactobacillus sucicola DSM 21376 = JCM 15457]